MTMELLRFKCAKIVLEDATLERTCREVFGADSCSCILVWQLHKLDFDTDGSVVKKLEGAGGRIDYHIVAVCHIDVEVAYHDIGYIYHTTNWRQNTYHSEAPSPHCTRALVVCGKISLAQSFRHAVAAAWLSLSGKFCVVPRDQLHPDEFSSGAPDADASAGAQSSPWVFPSLPVAGASTDINLILENIIRQCQLVYPPTSSKDEKRKMVKRLLVNWHPDKATFMRRDSKVCHEVFLFLQRLRESLSLD